MSTPAANSPSSCVPDAEVVKPKHSIDATSRWNRDESDATEEAEISEDEDDELDEEWNDDKEDEEENDYFDIHVNIWGKPQVLLPSLYDRVMAVVVASENYMNDNILFNPAYDRDQRHACRNLNGYCSQWASDGECESNPEYSE